MLIKNREIIRDPITKKFFNEKLLQPSLPNSEQVVVQQEILAQQEHSVQYQLVLDEIVSRKNFIKIACEGDETIHCSGTKHINFNNLEEVLVQKSPENIKDLKISSGKLEELELQVFDKTDTVLGLRQAFVDRIKTKDDARILHEEMNITYDLESEMVEKLVKDFVSDLGPHCHDILVNYLKITAGLINPSISSAMVAIYFSMKVGPAPMIIMYYTLSCQNAMKGFLNQIVSELQKTYTPVYQVST